MKVQANDAAHQVIHEAFTQTPRGGQVAFQLDGVAAGTKLKVFNKEADELNTFEEKGGVIKVALADVRPGDTVTVSSQGAGGPINDWFVVPDDRGAKRNARIRDIAKTIGATPAEQRFAVDIFGSKSPYKHLRGMHDAEAIIPALRGAQVALALKASPAGCSEDFTSPVADAVRAVYTDAQREAFTLGIYGLSSYGDCAYVGSYTPNDYATVEVVSEKPEAYVVRFEGVRVALDEDMLLK